MRPCTRKRWIRPCAAWEQETFEAIDQLKKINPDSYQPENGADYPTSRFGKSLMEIAELFKADLGLEVAFLDSGGWDHHVNEGGVQGQLSNLLRDLGQGIAAFHQDMGDRMGDVVFVSMSEFGRTAHENGNRGTDHGHANCMFLMGGDIKGGRVYSRWPGMSEGQLYEGRDLAVTTDYRSVLGEVMTKHLGGRQSESCLPRLRQRPAPVPRRDQSLTTRAVLISVARTLPCAPATVAPRRRPAPPNPLR